MVLTTAELEQRDRFAGFYRRNELPVMRRIERSVCGCDYGGTSWTTRGEADVVLEALDLKPGQHLLDLGAGSGWPGLYFAASSGCDISLADLPPEGLAIAAARAATDKPAGQCRFVAADACALPWADNSFDAITHSDLLCCLPGKAETLAECRRVLRGPGRMIFSVIVVAPDLDEADCAHALETGPVFIGTDQEYPEMLQDADWEIVRITDLTAQFLESTRDFQKFDQANRQAFTTEVGEEEFHWRQDKNARVEKAISDGLLRRELYEVAPV